MILAVNLAGVMTELVRTQIRGRIIMLSRSIFQTLAPGGQRYNVRTFLEEDIEIPIYEIPVQQQVRAC